MEDTNLKKNDSILLYMDILGTYFHFMFGESSASVRDSRTAKTFINAIFAIITQGKRIIA